GTEVEREHRNTNVVPQATIERSLHDHLSTVGRIVVEDAFDGNGVRYSRRIEGHCATSLEVQPVGQHFGDHHSVRFGSSPENACPVAVDHQVAATFCMKLHIARHT